MCRSFGAPVSVIDRPQDPRRIAGDDGVGRHVARDDAAGADDGVLADRRRWTRIVAPEPIDAPFLTSVGSTFQSLPVCSSPVGVVARDRSR